MVRSLSKYLGPQQGDVFEYNAEMKIDGKSIVIEQNIVGWEKNETDYNYSRGEWEYKTTSLSRSYVKNMPYILGTGLTGFYKWFAGVAGYSGFETIDILRTADNVVNWYDLLDRNVISREEVLKLIVANTQPGRYLSYTEMLSGPSRPDSKALDPAK